MTGKNLEIISHIVLWYENSFRIDCEGHRVNYIKKKLSSEKYRNLLTSIF